MSFYLDQYDWFVDYTLDIGDLGFIAHPYNLDYSQCPAILENSVTGVVSEHVRGAYIPFSEGSGNYTISISISDNYDAVVDSAVLIDNIRFKMD